VAEPVCRLGFQLELLGEVAFQTFYFALGVEQTDNRENNPG
jgi:hypothetical protein